MNAPPDPGAGAMSELRAMLLVVAIAATLVLGLDVAVCPMAGLCAVPCPSCGLTRATIALLHGDLRRSLLVHPGAIPVLIYLALGVLGLTQGRNSAVWLRGMTIGGMALVAGLTLLWILRFFGYFAGPVPVHAWRW
jgi:hypothetical protein